MTILEIHLRGVQMRTSRDFSLQYHKRISQFVYTAVPFPMRMSDLMYVTDDH